MRLCNIDLRCVAIDGEPWFVARDICAALGLTNVIVALASLPNDAVSEVSRAYFGMRNGGRDMALIFESGLYKLIKRTNRPEAKDFQLWVTAVVLPAIHKNGVTRMFFAKSL